jgi:pilus assembly protein FimV
MTAISDILSAQASKDDRLDTMRVPSAGDAPTFDLDSRPSTSQLFELPPLEMKMASPVAQEPAQRLPIGIDRSEPVTEPASSLSNLLDDESLLDQTASVGGKRPVAAPTHKFEFADIAKELDQRAGEAALKLDQDLSDFDDRTIEFGKVDPQRQDATTVGATADYIETKLDLATAYLDMGDQVGARSLLDEVLKEGDPSQKERAAELLRKV